MFGPPQIFPPVPINEPGNGAQQPITFVPGVYQDFFQPAQQIAPLATQKLNPIGPPDYVPPLNFNLKV